MKTIVMATGNKHKVCEISEMLSPYMKDEYRLVSMREAGFDGEIIEDGSTFEENALIKARTVAEATGLITISDDSGLCVDALGGRPGIYSARYGNSDDYNVKIGMLLEELKDVPDSERSARFECVVACVIPGVKEFVCHGTSEGSIIREKRGSGTFGYDPVFYSSEAGKTFAELSTEEKSAVSHRGRAMEKFIHIFFIDK